MNTTVSDQRPPRTAGGEAPPDVPTALQTAARDATSRQSFYREALRILAKHFDTPYAAIDVDTDAGSFTHHIKYGRDTDRHWKTLCDGLLLDTRYRNLPVARLFDSEALNQRFSVMAVPITESGAVTGSMVVVVSSDGGPTAKAQLSELHAIVTSTGLLATSLQRGATTTPPGGSHATPTSAAKVAGYSSLHEFAFALANGLKSKLGLDQVCLGRVSGSHVRLLCISGLDDLYPRSPGARLIQQAMEECLDAGQSICFQHDNSAWADRGSTGHLLHKQWHNETGNSAVASVPISVNDECVAIISLRNHASGRFKPADLDKVSEVVAPLMSGLSLIERANQSLGRHGMEFLGGSARKWLGRGAWGRKAILAALLLMLAWVAFGRMDFVITVPCEIVPGQVRHVASPIDGTLSRAHVEPGDRVQRGDLLLEFDIRDLTLQREQLASERSIAELDLARALSANEHSLAAQAAARIEMMNAQLELVSHQIARSAIRAPTDGVVLSGDATRRVGEVVPIGETLLEFSPAGQWTVELQVPQYAVSYLEPGQHGKFTTTARPDQSGECRLTRPAILSQVDEGRHSFVAECHLIHSPGWIRAGMTGIVKLNAGQRPVWWVSFHRAIDTVRMWLWKL